MPSFETPPKTSDTSIPNLRESEAYCRQFTRSHRENFLVSTFLLPRAMRQHFANVYTFCRTADDLADEIESTEESLRQLASWEEELLKCFDGEPSHIAFVALQKTIREFSIPPTPFLNLLKAFRQDQQKSTYSDFDDLMGYCCNSANPVGHLILYLADAFDDRRAALSDHICTGLQLVNFVQGVGPDFRLGRVYMPQDFRTQFGVNDDMLSAASASHELKALLKDMCACTDTLFDLGSPLVEEVPEWLRVDLDLFIGGGRAAVEAVRRADFDVLANRCSVSRWTSAKLFARAALRQRWIKRGRRGAE